MEFSKIIINIFIIYFIYYTILFLYDILIKKNSREKNKEEETIVNFEDIEEETITVDDYIEPINPKTPKKEKKNEEQPIINDTPSLIEEETEDDDDDNNNETNNDNDNNSDVDNNDSDLDNSNANSDNENNDCNSETSSNDNDNDNSDGIILNCHICLYRY